MANGFQMLVDQGVFPAIDNPFANPTPQNITMPSTGQSSLVQSIVDRLRRTSEADLSSGDLAPPAEGFTAANNYGWVDTGILGKALGLLGLPIAVAHNVAVDTIQEAAIQMAQEDWGMEQTAGQTVGGALEAAVKGPSNKGYIGDAVFGGKQVAISLKSDDVTPAGRPTMSPAAAEAYIEALGYTKEEVRAATKDEVATAEETYDPENPDATPEYSVPDMTKGLESPPTPSLRSEFTPSPSPAPQTSTPISFEPSVVAPYTPETIDTIAVDPLATPAPNPAPAPEAPKGPDTTGIPTPDPTGRFSAFAEPMTPAGFTEDQGFAGQVMGRMSARGLPTTEEVAASFHGQRAKPIAAPTDEVGFFSANLAPHSVQTVTTDPSGKLAAVQEPTSLRAEETPFRSLDEAKASIQASSREKSSPTRSAFMDTGVPTSFAPTPSFYSRVAGVAPEMAPDAKAAFQASYVDPSSRVASAFTDPEVTAPEPAFETPYADVEVTAVSPGSQEEMDASVTDPVAIAARDPLGFSSKTSTALSALEAPSASSTTSSSTTRGLTITPEAIDAVFSRPGWSKMGFIDATTVDPMTSLGTPSVEMNTPFSPGIGMTTPETQSVTTTDETGFSYGGFGEFSDAMGAGGEGQSDAGVSAGDSPSGVESVSGVSSFGGFSAGSISGSASGLGSGYGTTDVDNAGSFDGSFAGSFDGSFETSGTASASTSGSTGSTGLGGPTGFEGVENDASFSGSSESGDGEKIICGYFYKKGRIPRNIYVSDLLYARKYLSDETKMGYRIWATPLVRFLERKDRPILDAILFPVTKGWVYEMAYRMGRYPSSSLWGRIVVTVGERLCSGLYKAIRMLRLP